MSYCNCEVDSMCDYVFVLLLYVEWCLFFLKVSAETSVAANVISLSEVLSRFVLPSLPAISSSHSILLQVIHAVEENELLPAAGNF